MCVTTFTPYISTGTHEAQKVEYILNTTTYPWQQNNSQECLITLDKKIYLKGYWNLAKAQSGNVPVDTEASQYILNLHTASSKQKCYKM